MNKDEIARNEAVEVLRDLVSTIRFTPDGEGELHIELVGELRAIMLLGQATNKKPRYRGNEAYSATLVAGADNRCNRSVLKCFVRAHNKRWNALACWP
ncbi:hypothetical protein AB3G45_25860 [Shinella sp. S4-D37]|uniref:hypothetical protein n=1 Tax=Shinella sp. S4-D37 TaxID=3161999 RepID=UPI0034655113